MYSPVKVLCQLYIDRNRFRVRGVLWYKKRPVCHQILQNSFYIVTAQMDSFTYIAPTQEIPINNDDGGSGGNAYSVVAHTTNIDTPTNMDDGGSGGNAYCVVA